ncbi:HK97 family phage prohead protease [Paraburkholderia sediminicola]|uniref:HK97 family phage prohead protease n=1 Tax=Paraburkholderia sediminicola TaxID=458836 RepID=UPI0038BCDDDE
MEKSFSTLEIKALREDAREIEGIASTPTVDRVGDIVEPTGLAFSKEAPLLLNHDHAQPVGTVTFGHPTAKGLPFKAKIAKLSEPGTVKDRTDEAWHSVKNGLIKGVSIGFIPEESKPLSNGGTRFTKASVHELSLTAIPCNPEAVITAFKSVEAAQADVPEWLAQSGLSKEVIAKYMQLQTDGPKPATAKPANPADVQTSCNDAPETDNTSLTAITTNKDSNTMNANNTNANHFIRSVIAKAVAGTAGDAAAEGYAATRWGANSDTTRYVKAAVNPLTAGPDASGALTVGDISRQQFVQAVFSRSILGQLQGLVRVPAITRINTEDTPTSASFFGESVVCPVAQGTIGVQLVDKRKVGVIAVVSQELLKATDDAAEATISAMLQRSLSRGLDDAFVGNQARNDVFPAGLSSMATQASSFAAGIEAFTGDLTAASVLVNPLTAVTLRSPTETQITASGGIYGGLPAIGSYAVPAGKLFIVDATRVLAFIGAAVIEASEHGNVYGIAGAAATVPVNMFQTHQVALRAGLYADWELVPGATVEVSLAA